MTDLFIVDFSGGDDERARREAEIERLHDRYRAHLATAAGLDDATASRVVAALFDHRYPDGHRCHCGCHPRPSEMHGNGFDCPCTWSESRRAAEHRKLRAFWDTPAARELRARDELEEAAIAAWLAEHPGVQARRRTSFAPEQWEGIVDGHSFYFRERHGLWRIEVDLAPNGHFAKRFVGTDADGSAITEPVEMTSGEVIAEGADSDLGKTRVEHLALIVRTIRDHLRQQRCTHTGAFRFCPSCGARMP